MQLKNIGVVSPGDMGQAVASRLKGAGFNVYTALDGRSARTRALAEAAGLEDCGSMSGLVATCDMILSILNPASAVDKAREVAAAMRATGKKPVFVDCNAIAPQTAHEIDGIIHAAGGEFVDAGIIGSPPRGKTRTRIYVSGPGASLFTQITDVNLDIRIASERIGDASSIKMCYASFTKGAVALGVEFMIAGRKLGVDGILDRELQESLAEIREWILARSVSMPPKAYRWVPEMLEIAKTFEGAGMTPRILQGAADMFEFIAATPLGRESPEQAREQGRDGAEVVRQLADAK
ncbi:MAG: NAD(P)-dependent oxidoreductase [Burkholderiales bacterium]|nr:NAD(P)-dependent oxidoreductase [Burkholderiales bacterium]